jgi:deoxyribodipyrimidine photo-lyase
MAVAESIVWFRNDLRVEDNPALCAAVERGGPVIPVYIFSPDEEGDWPPGGASRWWLHQSLRSLSADLHRLKSRLVIRQGPALKALQTLVRETEASAVFWNRRYEPAITDRDAKIKKALREDGLDVESFNGSLLKEPWEIHTSNDTPFKVFTPFWRKCQAEGEPGPPLAAPERLKSPATWPEPLPLDALELEPTIPWDKGMREAWEPGTAGAHGELKRFLKDALEAYHENRDRPDHNGTSRLSPYLHFGELSPRQIWHAVRKATGKGSSKHSEHVAEPYLRQLMWREFGYHLMYHFPQTPLEPLREEFADFPWESHPKWKHAWEKGKTGFPYIDAGMRQLWTTGWMHNRVRMAVASFLVKDLLIPWQTGARWFWDTLVDADLANNTLGWQWTAGCGADAAPYFRVFNPVDQGKRFDPQGDYIRRWVPELATLPDEHLHEPWKAPASVLRDANVELGKTYPHPLVDHAEARRRALDALQQMKR